MRNFQDKNKWRRIVESKLVLMLLSILILVFVWGMFGFVDKMRETVKNKKIAESKMAELVKSKEKRLSDIEKLKTEIGLEESIREKFGLAKEGEGVIVILDDKDQASVSKQSTENGFFSFVKNWFK